MIKTQKELSEELSNIGSFGGWNKMILHIQRLILEARLDELEELHAIMDGDFGFAKEQRKSELESKLKTLNEGARKKVKGI